jgi:hypothetical protein
VDAFLNGKRIDIFNGQGLVKTNTVQVAAPIPGFVDGTAAGVVPINVDIPGGGGGGPPVIVEKRVTPKAVSTVSRPVKRR